jgi:nicotinamidase-related amidase
MGKTALIVVDMLVDFVTGALANPHAAAIVPNIAELAEAVRQEGGIVVFANDAHLPGDVEEGVWGQHALAGSAGAEVVPELAPKEGDYILPKRFYGSFNQTGLDALLRQNGVDTVIVTGQHTNMCVRHTSYEAFCAGYAIVAPSDCTAMFGEMSPEDYAQAQKEALDYLVMAYGAKVVDSWKEVR